MKKKVSDLEIFKYIVRLHAVIFQYQALSKHPDAVVLHYQTNIKP